MKGLHADDLATMDHRQEGWMDEYQEELLEYRASEHDPVEPAEDATEL
jgi:hypothetical protein